VKRDHITSHIRVHVPLKPHKCDFCQKAFKRPQDLKKHVKTHAEDPNYQASPDTNRSGHHGGGPGVFAGQPKHGDLQHLAVTAYGYSSDGHHMPPSGPVYSSYSNGTQGNAHSYQGPSNHYQANYMTTLYPVSSSASTLNSEYEIRKKATFDALNEFFGDIKSRQIDPGMYNLVGQRLMGLSNLPNYTASTEYSGGTAVASASHPPSLNHYTLPMPNLRTKNDLQNIDQFLEQLQATVYEHETANNAASAGVHQPGSHYVPTAGNFRSSHSPPRPTLPPSSHVLAAVTTSASDTTTPALTPASTVMSYNSPGSVNSTTISPVSRPTNPLYPVLPTVSSIAEAGPAYTATSNAGLTATYEDSQRYRAGRLNAPRPSSPDSLPKIDRLGVRSPSLSNVDPALHEASPKKSAGSQSPLDPALREATSGASASSEDPDWIVKIRTLEAIRNMIKLRLENHDFEDSDDDGQRTPKAETEEESEARSLYPVIRAVREAS
jgi:hypothetical protein